MQTLYEHKQPGTVVLILILIPVLILLAVFGITRDMRALPVLIFVLVILLGALWIFSSLTVQVDARQVRFYFGPGVFRHAFRLKRVRDVQVVRNPIWYGLGIHFIPGGVLYNVSGLDAVELTMEDGRVVRIGSDEPDDLAEAIDAARRLPGSAG